MKDKETIPVYIKIDHGKTVCICSASKKKCKSATCEKDEVFRDRFKGWKSTFQRDRYGR